jgi:hypothetical protein
MAGWSPLAPNAAGCLVVGIELAPAAPSAAARSGVSVRPRRWSLAPAPSVMSRLRPRRWRSGFARRGVACGLGGGRSESPRG